MEKIERFEVTFSSLLPVFSKRIEKWKPPRLKSEIAYRDELLSCLRKIVPEDVRVEKEYRHRGTTIDIWIGWKGYLFDDELAIEIKHNLNKKTDFDRLVGQIEGLDPKENKILVALIGETDPALIGRLKGKYSEMIKTDEPKVAIIQVNV